MRTVREGCRVLPILPVCLRRDRAKGRGRKRVTVRASSSSRTRDSSSPRRSTTHYPTSPFDAPTTSTMSVGHGTTFLTAMREAADRVCGDALQLDEQLLQTYFVWQAPQHMPIDEEAFRRELLWGIAEDRGYAEWAILFPGLALRNSSPGITTLASKRRLEVRRHGDSSHFDVHLVSSNHPNDSSTSHPGGTGLGARSIKQRMAQERHGFSIDLRYEHRLVEQGSFGGCADEEAAVVECVQLGQVSRSSDRADEILCPHSGTATNPSPANSEWAHRDT